MHVPKSAYLKGIRRYTLLGVYPSLPSTAAMLLPGGIGFQEHAADAVGAFLTVSERVFSEARKAQKGEEKRTRLRKPAFRRYVLMERPALPEGP